MSFRHIALTALLASLSVAAAANDCSVTIDSNDAMRFDTKAVSVSPGCETFTVHLTHSGKMARNVMGHNWVLVKSSDFHSTATDGMAAGLDNHYVKPGDSRVIAFTDVIGGGEKTSVTFPVSKLSAGESYTFFCSFPGHFAIMQGSLRLGS